MLDYFRSSAIFTLICLILAFLTGYLSTHSVSLAFSGVLTCLILALLEISLSFDNAVVNASVLQKMSALWQKRFLTWGMVIAVFGMRLVFPLLIVAVSAHLGPVETLKLALSQPDRYALILSKAHTGIMGFGGAFLLMVGLGFFFDEEKKTHWLAVIERPLQKLSACKGSETVIVLMVVFVIARFLPEFESFTFLSAAVFGLIAYITVQGLGSFLEDLMQSANKVAKAGLGTFIYLEMMDASFSFDGVIGSFALTNNLIIIALGLGIGAMFVRSLTMMLVKRGTLNSYRYLEHGAFWAILVLGMIMLVSTFQEIPELVTGLAGIGLIVASLMSSVIRNRKVTKGMDGKI
ncbi:DUF475 domain-containing protein [Acetobacteraceae bacterium ESL0709]|nr:DUF475 domain-containing protein [Acetobacteraceae bacterium ESL0697]MDF7678448.1 DUF475 domain-containing protein [Acetobacteraceae bacterium ESL0709]